LCATARSVAIFLGVVARKRALGLLDFDDLLLYCERCRRRDRREEIGGRLYHVLVDEFQDVNKLQLDILMGLRRCDSRLTMVATTPRHLRLSRASPRFLLDAQDYFAGLVTITELNYRSLGRFSRSPTRSARCSRSSAPPCARTSRYSVRALRAWCTAR